MRIHHSRIDTVRKKPAISHQPPWFSGGSDSPYCGRGGSSDSQNSWRTNCTMSQLTEASMLKPMMLKADEAEDQRRDAQRAQVDRPDLGHADAAQQVQLRQVGAGARAVARRQRHAQVGRTDGLHLGEEVLVLRHVWILLSAGRQRASA